MKQEIEHLEKIALVSKYAAGLNGYTVKYSQSIFERHLKEGSLLEMGPAEGIMTDFFVTKYDDVTVVEGSSLFCEKLAEKHPNITVINSLFEDFQPPKQYDNIVLGHVLEHVLDPIPVLEVAFKALAPGGTILAAVPNAKSIHRQAAVKMGMLNDIHQLNEMDHYHGHRRVYSPELLEKDFQDTGFKVEKVGGYWIKPLSNSQIEQTWSHEMIMAFMELGEKYPEIAAEIFVVATK